jgi:plasmid stability protein
VSGEPGPAIVVVSGPEDALAQPLATAARMAAAVDPSLRSPGPCWQIGIWSDTNLPSPGSPMKAMTLRNLDPQVAETLRRRARAEGRSLNAIVLDILTRAAADEERRARIRAQRPRAERLRRETRRRFGRGTPSERLVREDRRR